MKKKEIGQDKPKKKDPIAAYFKKYPHLAVAAVARSTGAMEVQKQLDGLIGLLDAVEKSMPTRDEDLVNLVRAASLIIVEVGIAWCRRKGTK
jgi:hypothetical protein